MQSACIHSFKACLTWKFADTCTSLVHWRRSYERITATTRGDAASVQLAHRPVICHIKRTTECERWYNECNDKGEWRRYLNYIVLCFAPCGKRTTTAFLQLLPYFFSCVGLISFLYSCNMRLMFRVNSCCRCRHDSDQTCFPVCVCFFIIYTSVNRPNCSCKFDHLSNDMRLWSCVSIQIKILVRKANIQHLFTEVSINEKVAHCEPIPTSKVYV